MTPDAIIPDWTSGQNWNQYAYVLNDPLTWVDPSGFESGLPPADGWGVLEQYFHDLSDGFEPWWTGSPCDCSGSKTDTTFWGLIATDITTVATGLGSSITTLSIQSRLGRGIVGLPWKTVKNSVKPTEEVAKTVLNYGRNWKGPTIQSGVLRQTRTVVRTRVKPATGFGGILGGIALTGIFDAALQALSDSSRCMGMRDRLHNMVVAGGYGMLSAIGGAAVGLVALAVGAPVWAAVAGAAVVGYILDNGTVNTLNLFGIHTKTELSPIVRFRDKQLR